jgi:hypothetical protein
MNYSSPSQSIDKYKSINDLIMSKKNDIICCAYLANHEEFIHAEES